MLMLRNLVSSLIEHDQITTTVAKAKETARLADKVITWSKKGQRSHKEQANRFLLVSPLLDAVFLCLHVREADSPDSARSERINKLLLASCSTSLQGDIRTEPAGSPACTSMDTDRVIMPLPLSLSWSTIQKTSDAA